MFIFMERLIWVLFFTLVLILLAIDLRLASRRQKSRKEEISSATFATIVYVSIALLFTLVVYFVYSNGWIGNLSGGEAAVQYLAGYLMEKSLSLDNILVISLIFNAFQIPPQFHHRVLFLGILGVLVMRFIMIAAGLALLERFWWTIPIFGCLLLYSAFQILRNQENAVKPQEHKLYRLAMEKNLLTDEMQGESLFIKKGGQWLGTPLFAALVFIESADLVFALDSIPAVFGVTTDPFLVFSSNIFAILGLRSLYFVLVAMIEKFHYLKHSLAILLAFIGVKMLIGHYVPIPTAVSLLVIVSVLGFGAYFSWVYKKPE